MTNFRFRHYFVVIMFSLVILTLIWRMVDLIVVKRSFLQKQGDARALRMITVPAYRGMITDRNGEPLAISTPVDSLWINPQDFAIKHEKVSELLAILNMSHEKIESLLKTEKDREFLYLRRGLNPSDAEKIREMKIPGVYFQREFRRFYPLGEVTSHLIGFTNIDDKGQEGIELAYDSWLRGERGKKCVIKDCLGHIVANVKTIKQPLAGNNLALSIDKRIQYHAFQELKAAVETHQAKSGSIVILDVKTGEVLAMANQPSYNPNSRDKVDAASFRNRALTDNFEPGSVLKSFAIAAALESGKYNQQSTVDTNPGYIKFNHNLVQDFRNYGVLSLADILMRSSNVGVTKIILSLPSNTLWTLLHNVGFGEAAVGTFPGESSGKLPVRQPWKPFTLATLAFGYGMSSTPVQLARAYASFANHGKLNPVSLLLKQEQVESIQAISPQVADHVLAMLENVVEKSAGTGRLARVYGYRIAGKTSTVRLVGAKGYEEHKHIATFVGVAPADNPRVVVVVVICDPQAGDYFGGSVAAPVFARVMKSVLPILHVVPNQHA